MYREFLLGKLLGNGYLGNGKDVRMVLRSILVKLFVRWLELAEDCSDGRFLCSWCSISELSICKKSV
jgi:hypothetical protein